MRVRFWGTRGSIPVALTSADIRHKIEQALALAIARGVDSPEKLKNFIAHDLDFGISHTYGGHSSCVELETGRAEYLVCDMGSGARAFGNSILLRVGGSPPVINVIMSHVHWDHIMGFPFFAPAYIPGRAFASTAVTTCSNRRSGCSSPRRAFRWISHGWPPISSSCNSAGRQSTTLPASACTPKLQAPLRRLVRLPVRARRQNRGLLDRLRAQARRPGGNPRLRRFLPRRRPGDLRCHVLAARRNLGEGGLGTFEQHGRRGARADWRV